MQMKTLGFGMMLLAFAGASEAQGVSRAVQQGVDKGFKSCAPALDRVVKHVHSDDSKYAHLGTWNKADANEKVFNALTILPYADGASFASFTGVRTTSGACNTVMTQVLPIPGTSCASLRETTFKAWKFLQDLGGVPIYEPVGDESTSVLLSPMGSGGCLVIKHAVVYE